MSNNGKVVSVNISREKGTIKEPVPEVTIDKNGVVGDAHAGPWHRQVSLLSQESIDRFIADSDHKVAPGEFAENITTSGIDLPSVRICDRLRIGDVLLEVTQLGKKCHGEACAIFKAVGHCVMPTDGIFCRVLETGTVRPGDEIARQPRTLRCRVITMSDRAHAGEYEDRSGPLTRDMLETFLHQKQWAAQIESKLLPDEGEALRLELVSARDSGIDLVITTGGTGVGPRDVTPEVAREVCDRVIPGIMENIRVKYGSKKPNALLSRGIAGIAGTTQVYTLPGSRRAVEEYMTEILKTVEHIVFMLRGLDVH